MTSRSGLDRRKGSRASSSNGTPMLSRTNTRTSDSFRSEDSAIGSDDLHRTDSYALVSPTSQPGSFSRLTSSTASTRPTPFRSRTQSTAAGSISDSKQPLEARRRWIRSSSIPTAVRPKVFSLKPYQRRSHSAAARLRIVEPEQSRDRSTTSLTPNPAVTSKSAEQVELYPHSPVDQLQLRRSGQTSERVSTKPKFIIGESLSLSSSSPDLIDTPAELGGHCKSPEEKPENILDKVNDLRHLFGKKSAKKVAKETYPKPDRADLLEKPETQKISKWFRLIERQQQQESSQHQTDLTSPEREIYAAEFFHDKDSCIQNPPLTSPVGIELREEFRFYLPSISEAPSRDEGKPLPPLPQTNMDSTRLTPGSRLLADQQDKNRRVKDAQEMYQTVVRNAERSNSSVPPYEFLELIGKGAFGRVYKCRDKRSGNLVAVKINSIDDSDWSRGFAPGSDQRDENIRDFTKEVSTLQQLKDNKTKNVNVIHDAFDLHSQLWIVADYCTGGSVRTLLRPFEKDGRPRGLPEHFIIPIARELAVALKGMHEMDIIHRDIKCANVYITEDGDIQLGDFGIVGVLEDGVSKRKTVIGTPHWMPQEMVAAMDSGITEEGYGTEIDIWSYGITIFEMAVGLPPNSNKQGENLARSMEIAAPRLEKGEHSEELRDFVAFCLNSDPKARPTAEEVLRHSYVANTSKKYPTSSLVQLVERFKRWEYGGGSRASLWIANTSDPRVVNVDDDETTSDSDEIDGWNFSTSDDFDQRFSQVPALDYLEAPSGAGLPPGLRLLNTESLESVEQRVKREHTEFSASRGEQYLAPIYHIDNPLGYQLATPVVEELSPPPPSDLPLRNFTSDAPTRESMIEIDLNEADVNETATSTFAMHMDALNENTVKPAARKPMYDDDDDDNFQYGQHDDKRATMEWTFPSSAASAPSAPAPQPKRGTMDWTFQTAEPAQPEQPEFSMNLPSAGTNDDLPPGFRPFLRHTATEPIGHFRDFSHEMGSSATSPVRNSVTSMIDLDLGLADPPERLNDPADIIRPSTASSATGSTMTDMTSGNPFDLEDDPVQNEIDRNRFSYHKQWQSEGGHMKRRSHKAMQMHTRGSSLSSTDSDVDRRMSAVNDGMEYHSDPMQPPPMSFGLGEDLGQEDTNQWPNFDSFDTSPRHFPTLNDVPKLGEQNFPLERGLRTNGYGFASSRSREPSAEPHRPEVDFPAIRPPHPDALDEDADSQVLDEEVARGLDDLTRALDSVEQSFRGFAKVDDEEDDLVSDIESGLESTRDTEDEGTADQLTSRRSKPRKLEIRGSPRMVQNGTFQ